MKPASIQLLLTCLAISIGTIGSLAGCMYCTVLLSAYIAYRKLGLLERPMSTARNNVFIRRAT